MWGEARNTVLPESVFYIQIFSLFFYFYAFSLFYIFYIFRFFHFFTFLHFYNFQIFSLFYIFTFLQFFRGHSSRCFLYFFFRADKPESGFGVVGLVVKPTGFGGEAKKKFLGWPIPVGYCVSFLYGVFCFICQCLLVLI